VKSFVKVARVTAENGKIRLRRTFRSWRLEPSQISAIKLERVLSLVDEIGVFLDAEAAFFFTDATPGFQKAAELLKFDELFGNGWYHRAESGETLSWKRQTL